MIATESPWLARPVIVAWYMREREAGENARTRWPTLMRPAWRAGTTAVTVRRPASMAPAIRTQTWIGRTDTSVTVRVSSAACDSVTPVAGFQVGRVRSR